MTNALHLESEVMRNRHILGTAQQEAMLEQCCLSRCCSLDCCKPEGPRQCLHLLCGEVMVAGAEVSKCRAVH